MPTKISELSTGTLTNASEFVVNNGGTSNKVTGEQIQAYAQRRINQSLSDQTINAATTAYLNGSNIVVPATGLKIGTTFIWSIAVSKTAAGTAANTFNVLFGPNGTTADTSRLALTTGTATAAVDQGQIDITVVVRSVSASGTVAGLLELDHELASTGLHNKATRIHHAVSGTFATNASGLYVGLSCTTAASTVLTFPLVTVEARNL
jgi:hypothetical protein